MKIIATLASLVFSAALAMPAEAQVVIISAKNPITKLTKDQVTQIFLGQAKTFFTGGQAIPLDQPDGSDLRKEFYQKAMGKAPAQMKAYWSKMEFSGNARAPHALSSAEIVKMISENPKYIGYVDASAVTEGVKVVLTF